ncbi:hypothetical protein BDV12DRAFT_120242 [Aspergillus spectabilis]
MALQFIDHSPSGIGSFERRLIRSHVMQGKNKGKPRRSIKKQRNVAELKCALSAPYVIPRQVFWGDLCLTSFPEQLDSESTALMHRWFFDISDVLFPPQFCTKFDIIKSTWVNCILADEAYFHSTLAISASYVDFVQRKPAISSKTLHHISQAYALVNNKLSGPFAASDSAIAAVVSLAIYQQVHCQPATGLIHLHGLYRMIQLRGGIAKLMQENRALALKPLRLDVELAMQNGTCALFHGDEVPVRPVLCNANLSNRDSFEAAPLMPPIMLALLSFSRLLNKAERSKYLKLDPLDYTETLLWLLYRLIEAVPPLHPSTEPGACNGDVSCLTMLAFMTTLLPEYTRDGPRCPLSSNRLGNVVQDIASEFSDSNPPLLLWMLFIGGISVLNLKDHPWLSRLITNTCERLELDTWADIQRRLSQFPWIFALHEAPGRRLWDDVLPSRELS